MSRPFIWVGILSMLLLAVLLLAEWPDSQVEPVALVVVDNQSGEALEAVVIQWNTMEQVWPGVKAGQSALIPLVLVQPATVSLILKPSGQQITRRVEAGQRFHVRLGQPFAVTVSEDPGIVQAEAPGER